MFTESVRVSWDFLACHGGLDTNPPQLLFPTVAPPTWRPAYHIHFPSNLVTFCLVFITSHLVLS